ncbi:MAG: phosphatase PAP2 family protein [Sphaerochaeta sp.]|nr:phosphatase PAP2 family protein [Sphaerochaeta sp.]
MRKATALLGLFLVCTAMVQATPSTKVNAFDRSVMLPYSESLDTAGTLFVAASVLAPALLLAEPASEYVTIGVMYAQAMLAAYGLKELGKLCIPRARPFLYFDDYPLREVTEGDAYDSFPSGHVTMAFAGAAFASSVFASYHPDSVWKVPVAVVSYTLATATALLRVASGSHFMTDVLAGALIGTAGGLGIPLLHARIGKQDLEASFSPYSLAFGISW